MYMHCQVPVRVPTRYAYFRRPKPQLPVRVGRRPAAQAAAIEKGGRFALVGRVQLSSFPAQDYRRAQVACTMPTIPPFVIRPRPPPLFAPSVIFRFPFFSVARFLARLFFRGPAAPPSKY